jgi:hypothetical protein
MTSRQKKGPAVRPKVLVPLTLLLFQKIGLCQLPPGNCRQTNLVSVYRLHSPAPEEGIATVGPIAASCVNTLTDLAQSQSNHGQHAGSELSNAIALPLPPASTSPNAEASPITIESSPQRSFRWRRALLESFTFLVIEQAYVVHEDYRWVISENGVPFNHYWRDYKQSLSTQFHSGWNDGDDPLYNYVGHPIQGAMTSYIQMQNDPRSEKLEFSNSKEYWWSRFKGTLWSAAYSTLWSMGPVSEMTVEKYGTHTRGPWKHDGTWPCSTNCYTGVGQVNLVITPIGGLGWVLGEDLLDKYVARRIEHATGNRFLIDVTRCTLNPIRGGANILHGKRPWYRASRDKPR